MNHNEMDTQIAMTRAELADSKKGLIQELIVENQLAIMEALKEIITLKVGW